MKSPYQTGLEKKEDRITSSAARSDDPRSAIDPKPRKQTSNVTGKSDQRSVDSASMRNFGKVQPDSKKVDKDIKKTEKNPRSEPKGDKDYQENKPPTEKERNYVQDLLNRTRERGAKIGKEIEDMENVGKGTDIQRVKKPQNRKSLTGDSVSTYKGGNGGDVIDMKPDASGVFQLELQRTRKTITLVQ